jgi:lipopolysaccharide/colanic/teichoic acid biosynthesis glycosyltransferase
MTLSWFLRYGGQWRHQPKIVEQAFATALLGACLLWSILSSRFHLDGSSGGWRLPEIVARLLLAVGLTMVSLLATGYLTRILVSRLILAYFALISFVGLVCIRVAACAIAKARTADRQARRIVIIGSGAVAQEVAARYECHPETLSKVIGFLMPEDSALGIVPGPGTPSGIPESRLSSHSVMELLASEEVDELVFVNASIGKPAINELMDQCVKRGIAISVVPQPYELYLSAPELMDLDGIPILHLRHSFWSTSDPAWKRGLDLVLGIPLFLLSLPLMMCGAVFLRLSRGVSGFCGEERYGLRGRKFTLYRLNSPRISTDLPFYERILQHLSITELPQLFNVLIGDMSLVGPRPHGHESVRHYTDWHRQRLNAKPGITGLAQVHGLRQQNPLEDMTRYDLQYILRRSVFQDLSLLLQTIWTLLARVVRIRELHEDSKVRAREASPSSILPAA